MAILPDVTRHLVPPFAFAGVAVARAGQPPEFQFAAAPDIQASRHSLFRVASISKIVTGQTLAAVADDLGRDIAEVLGFPLRNPAYPDVPITLAHVLSHSAGLTDAAGYLIPEGVRLADWIASTGAACFTDALPGTRAEYSNLGYVLVAAAAEALGGDRFDRLAARHVLDPLGIAGGFNWSGVPAEARRDRVATYRRRGSALIPQIDDRVVPEGVSGPDGQTMQVSGYEIGQSNAMFSPQGGLRLSLEGCLTLARALGSMDQTVLWAGSAGATPVFDRYGVGLQFFAAPHFYPRPLVGHFANAYGFAGGVWYDPERDLAFAYGLNGLPEGDTSDDLRPEELAIFDAIAQA